MITAIQGRAFAGHRLATAICLALAGHSAVAGHATTELSPLTIEDQARDNAPGGMAIDADAHAHHRNASGDTAGLLRQVPGLFLNGAGGVSSLPSIRGLADDRLRIRVDGMDLISSCPNHMNPPLSYLDPASVESLDVYAGITPVSLGGDSIGGTIEARTHAPVFADAGQSLTKGNVGARYASNGDARRANLSVTRASDRVSVNYSGGWSQADNYDAGDDFKTPDQNASGRPGHLLGLDEVASTAYETFNHALNLALQGQSGVFQVGLGYQHMPYQLYPNQRMDLLDNTQKRINLSLEQDLDWAELSLRAYHEGVDHTMNFGPDKRFWYGSNAQPPVAPEIGTPCSPLRFSGDPEGTCAAGMPMFSEGVTSGARLQLELPLNALDRLRLGGELQRYSLDDYWTASGGGMGPDTFENINDGQRDRLAAFAEWERQASRQWLTLLGLRYERVASDAGEVQGYKDADMPGNQRTDATAFNASDRSRTDHNLDVSALARYRHSDQLDIEFGLARKVRSPNLYERYTWSTWMMAASMNNFVGDGNGYYGNVELDPEQAHTLSATFDWHAADHSWAFKATPYYTHVNDYIDAVPGSPMFAADQFNVLTYANQSARLYGIDLSGHLPLGDSDLGSWSLDGSLSYPKSENRDTGDALYNVMPLNARLTLNQALGGWRNAAELVMVDAKDDLSAVRNEIATSGYVLFNLRASHQWKHLRLDFGVENLFDVGYALPTGGSYTGQGTTMSLNGIPWGIAVPGAGRSVYLGFNLAF